MSPHNARVFLIDDHPIVRAGARLAVAELPGFEICGETGTLSGAVQAAQDSKADIIVVDLILGSSGDGIALIESLREALPQAKILVFSMNSEEVFAERSIKAGANGYLMKGGDLSTLQEALREIHAGRIYVSQSLIQATGPSGGNAVSRNLSSLSDREMQVFLLIGAGKSTQQIATELGITMKTASAHRENLKVKLSLQNAPELVRFAVAYVVGQGRSN